MKNIKLSILALSLFVTSFLNAQTAPVDDHGLAIGGYDVVAYFSNQAVKGSSKYTAKHDGATYYFTSAENRNAFRKSPDQYLPQCGGYCAWGVAEKSSKFPINPETFDIVDGKLYLFFNGPFEGKTLNTMTPWIAETSRMVEAADKNWDKLKKS